MSFSASSWSIKNPTPPIVFFLILTVAGMIAYFKLPINNMPSIVVPIVSIAISQPGASPTELETEVTRKVEGAVASLQGVKHTQSTIVEGASTTIIEFHLDTSFDRAMNDTRDAISNIRSQLPRTILDPIIQRLEIDGGAILTYSVSSTEQPPEELSWFIDDTLSRSLLAIRGVAKVERVGGVEREITIHLDPMKMIAYGVSASDLSHQLASTHVNLPGGRILMNQTEYTIRTLGSQQHAENIANIRLSTQAGKYIYIRDIAAVTDGAAEVRSLARLNGSPVITFRIFRSQGSSEVTIARKVEQALSHLKKEHPTIQFHLLFSMVEFTEKTFRSTMFTFFEGAFLTIIVVFFFLKDKRSTFLAALAIPLSIIPTFLVLKLFGFSLNGVSLLAISLVTGVLVDDAIVEIENIHRHMDDNKTPYEAALVATEEIGLAVVATTLVICAVFMPVSFMGGIPGQFFKQFGLTVAVAAFFSLLVARLITPLLAAYWLKPPHKKAHISSTKANYQHLVEWTLNHRFKTLLIAVLTLVGSFMLVPLLSTGFLPYEDLSESKLKIELPRGSTLEQTDQTLQNIAAILYKRTEVKHVMTQINEAEGGVNKAEIQIKLTEPDERQLDQREFEKSILPELKKIPDIQLGFVKNDGTKEVSIALVSEDTQALAQVATQLEQAMSQMPQLHSITSSQGQSQPEILVTPDTHKIAQLGITVEQISNMIRIATLGDNENYLAKFNADNRQIPIRLRLPKKEYPNIEFLGNLAIPTLSGSAPLGSLARIEYSAGPTMLSRYDRQRKIAIEANLNSVPLGEALKQIYALPVMQQLPEQVKVQNLGDAEVMAELFEGFAIAIGAGLMMVYAIQVLLYKNWLQPLTRMAALPLSIGGAFLALLVTGIDMTLPSIIGILMLMGIADKNSILLVDHILELMQRGIPKREAIVQGCLTRARPIMMTSLAMLAGMMPIALGIDADSAFRAPMAIAVIGGLLSSTALSLVFVPMLFSYADDLETWLIPRLKSFFN